MFGKPSRCGLLLVLWLAAGCSRNQPRETVLGVAYVGPSTVRLRQELTSPAPDGAILRHGEKVEIIGRRRIFVRVRTAGGARGWILMRQLLSPQQMQNLDRLAERASRMPSHGEASVYAPLNVHTEPNRQAPAFYQIQEGERVEVLLQRLEPRVPYRNPDLLPPPAKTAPRPSRKRSPPPDLVLPSPPKPPANWLEISGWSSERIAERMTKSLPVDTWALVRLKSGRAGWVLARPLRMEIPDEVAQYSEGHRITSYFIVGTVTDRGEVKHNWLWTTIAPGNHPYDFDSFRYFVWNTRRHRYETAYVERKLKGYFPVKVHPVEIQLGARRQTWPGFSVIVEEADGQRYRKTYAYQVYLVRLVSKEPWQPAGEEAEWWRLAGR